MISYGCKRERIIMQDDIAQSFHLYRRGYALVTSLSYYRVHAMRKMNLLSHGIKSLPRNENPVSFAELGRVHTHNVVHIASGFRCLAFQGRNDPSLDAT